jgi:parallel beta-helix repeat protein
MRTVIEMTIGLAVMAASAQAATFINTCPFVISSPGDYVLSADLVCGGGPGILITSSDVTLKLEGHRIAAGAGANNGFSSAIGNFSGGITGAFVSRVRILGPGLITSDGGNAFLDGVSLVGFVTQSEVSGITVLGSRSAGIDGNGQAPGTTGLTFTANTLGRNGVGISVTNLTSSTISKNDVSGNGVGISILNLDVTGPPLIVSNNIINGNTGDGVQIFAGALLLDIVTVQNNVVSGNGGNGIFNQNTPAITHNTALANGMFDLFDTVPGCGAVWSNNTFFNANQGCIH